MQTEALSPEAAYVIEQMEAGFHLIPGHMRGGIKRYILQGIPPGNFLSALLSNDFMEAIGRADQENIDAIADWARFLYNYVPAASYGSPDAFSDWLIAGGAIGRQAGAA